MSQNQIQRDRHVNRAIHRLFWRAMLHAKGHSAVAALLHPPAFFIANIFVPLQIAYAIQATIHKDIPLVQHYVWIIVLATVVSNAILAFATSSFNRSGAYGCSFVQREIFANYLAKDYDFYANNHIGALGTQAARVRDAFSDYNRIVLFEIPKVTVMVVAGLAVLATLSPTLAGLTLLCISVIFGFTLAIGRFRLRYRRAVSQSSSALAGVLGDALSHATAVKTFAQEPYEQQRLNRPLLNWQRAQLKAWDSFTPANIVRTMTLSIAMGLLLLASAHLYIDGAISIAVVALVQLYIVRLINTTIEIGEIIKLYENVMSTAYQSVATMLVPSTIKDRTSPLQLPEQSSYELNFENVNYSYPEAKGRSAIDNFSLHIKDGEKIGLIGYSGGGKTTITKLLLRFMDIDDGSITVNGIDIREISQAKLRGLIAYVPQEPLLFHRSIKENIAYGRPEASDGAIKKAAETAYVDEFAKHLPGEYESMVGERGVKLSGGQRQRIAIARALLKDAPILVLDEATSALDSQSEHYIQSALWELMKDRTAIVIAHRLSTIQHLDRIVVIDEGHIVQIGTHAELLKKPKGIYAKLWAHQSDGYLVSD
ncbi:MAG: transporter [Candidatus Saccharibacteria bacterium]|nr:transporter [Candidatus Saccharibacteria bacterium]